MSKNTSNKGKEEESRGRDLDLKQGRIQAEKDSALQSRTPCNAKGYHSQ